MPPSLHQPSAAHYCIAFANYRKTHEDSDGLLDQDKQHLMCFVFNASSDYLTTNYLTILFNLSRRHTEQRRVKHAFSTMHSNVLLVISPAEFISPMLVVGLFFPQHLSQQQRFSLQPQGQWKVSVKVFILLCRWGETFMTWYRSRRWIEWQNISSTHSPISGA